MSSQAGRKHWFALTMVAGAVNAGAFIAARRFVSHVTGPITLLSVSNSIAMLVEFSLIVSSFIFGACVATVITDGKLTRSQPLVGVVYGAIAAILGGVALLGHAGSFGEFRADNGLRTIAFLVPVTFAMGMLNLTVARGTGTNRKTTHLTGDATDLGQYMALSLLRDGVERGEAVREMLLRMGRLGAFVAGAATMGALGPQCGFLAFLGPTALIVLACHEAIVRDARRLARLFVRSAARGEHRRLSTAPPSE